MLLGILGQGSGSIEEPWNYVQESVTRTWLRANRTALPVAFWSTQLRQGCAIRQWTQCRLDQRKVQPSKENRDYKYADIQMYSWLPLPPNGFLICRQWLLQPKPFLFCMPDTVQRREWSSQPAQMSWFCWLALVWKWVF